jgi:excisionase family DNA binding protein
MEFGTGLTRVEEVAALFDVSQRRVYALIREGLLPAVYLGRQVRVSRDALDAFVRDGGKRFAKGSRK